ncbi:MAG TPA: TrmH family RNA methyltransferase [Gemmatimonadaceae bacterium]|nr:TrmH family RNA methyltransferase [Gemmatimonadaceae bacterium]HRQ78916.1 TrmH family RNA methyltransferase [Gemmatimonadaceae bacterium]
MSVLHRVAVVLNKPQDQVNIAAVVRVMKNFGFVDLRLVDPVPYDPWRIEGVAHGTRDLVERIRHFATLEEALADCVFVAAFGAKRRAHRWPVTEPRPLAATVLEKIDGGIAALLFGQEDHGLPNEAIDRAQVLVRIPTTEHASLNLAQAVNIALYELHVAAGDATRDVARHKHHAPLPKHEEWERALGDIDRALAAIAFYRTRNPEHIMRSVRSLLNRAGPDSRELTLVRAMGIEVMRTIDRVKRGLEPE